MCGIAGVIGRPAEAEVVVPAMLACMAHRGPDGSDRWTERLSEDRAVVLGHRRLSVLDLSDAGRQPMADSTGRFHVTHNGEIYNFIEVRTELQALGTTFRSDTDTEVILEAYKRWGADCLARFNGMFAFAVYDRVRGVLFCARDRYGEKPFLFAAGADVFVFASEYKAVLLHPRVKVDVDEARLLASACMAGTRLDIDRDTVFRGVQQLLPGEAMEVNVRTLESRIWRYWDVSASPAVPPADEREVFAEFRSLLVDSVRLRLRSDVPVGSCLSGGLDSSAIVCIVRELLGPDAPYHTFTGRFPGTPADEWHYAAQVIDATGSVSHTVSPTADRFVADLPRFMWLNELPVESASQVAQWCVFDLARQHGVTVLLDGQGADETLGGYEQYFAAYVASLRHAGDEARLARELPGIRARYPLALVPAARNLRDRLPFRLRHWLSGRLSSGTRLQYGLTQEAVDRIDAPPRPSPSGASALHGALMQDAFDGFLSSLLRYGDRNSMAHSREVRLPFCDHRLAEFVYRLPPHLLMGDVQTKRLIRESLKGVLPEGVRTRWNKQGFRPPQDRWFEVPAFLHEVEESVRAACRRPESPWRTRWWESALQRVRGGEAAVGWVLWHPFMIEQWRRHFVEPLAEARARVAADLR